MKRDPPPSPVSAGYPTLEPNRRGAQSMRAWRTFARVASVALLLAITGCANAIDIICPPAGQCPNVRSGHGGGY